MQRRRRSTPHLLSDQIAARKARLEATRDKLPAGIERTALSRQIRELDLATQMDTWLSVTRMRPH